MQWQKRGNGELNQNAYIACFYRSFRNEVFDPTLFNQLVEIQELSQTFMISYNDGISHESLGTFR